MDSLHQHLNSVDPNIQFTVEKKGMANFVLYIILSQDTDGSINTSVYLQATHTDQYLDFHSVAHKWAVVRTLDV